MNKPIPTLHSLSALTSELVERGYEVWTSEENNGTMSIQARKGNIVRKEIISIEAILNEQTRSHLYTHILEEIERAFAEVEK